MPSHPDNVPKATPSCLKRFRLMKNPTLESVHFIHPVISASGDKIMACRANFVNTRDYTIMYRQGDSMIALVSPKNIVVLVPLSNVSNMRITKAQK